MYVSMLDHTLSPISNTSTSVPPLSLNFSRLIIYNGAHIVTWQDHALFLFNPFSVTLTCWTHNLRSIVDVQCTPPTQGGVARELFVLHEECRRITCLTVCTVEETLSLAIDQDRLEIATKVCYQVNRIKFDWTRHSFFSFYIVARLAS